VCVTPARRTEVGRKRHKADEIVAMLRQVDVLASQGRGIGRAGMRQAAKVRVT
jgi:hypothetical protein